MSVIAHPVERSYRSIVRCLPNHVKGHLVEPTAMVCLVVHVGEIALQRSATESTAQCYRCGEGHFGERASRALWCERPYSCERKKPQMAAKLRFVQHCFGQRVGHGLLLIE